MSLQLINLGTADNDGTGDSLKAAGQKINENFQKLPLNSKRYIALMSQNLLDPPSVNILFNTLGNIVWSTQETGLIVGTLNGAFTQYKTIPVLAQIYADFANNRDGNIIELTWNDVNSMHIINFLASDGSLFDNFNDILVDIIVFD